MVRAQLEAHLTIDAQQRIVDLDHGAEALLGVTREEAQQRRCYEVVGGRDAAERPVCGPDCPGVSAIRQGRLSGGAVLHLGRGTRSRRVRCRLTALPVMTGGAFVSLSPHQEPSGVEGQSVGSSAAPGVLEQLAALAAITTALSADTLEAGLERSLEFISEATGAEAADLFLSEPGGLGAVLTSHRGPFRRAFCQLVRFERGEGFPGLVLVTGAPLLSHRLQGEPRYLRQQVKDAGFQAYVCVPLHHHGEVLGSIGLAFRDATVEAVERARDFLVLVGGPIGMAVQATLAEAYAAAVDVDLYGAGLEANLEGLTRRMMVASGADAGEAQLLEAGTATRATTIVSVGALPAATRTLPTCALQDCPAIVRGRCEVLYGRPESWPAPCRSGHAAGGLRLCVPLLSHGAVFGLVRLWRRQRGNEPPSRDLVMVETLASSGSRLVAEERLRGDAEKRSHELYRWLLTAASEPPPAQQETAPHLSVRCFGSFELRVDGAPVLPRAVGRKKALTLLKVLLTHHGRPVTKDALIESLWPGGDPATKTSQLYVLVHELRRLLEPPTCGEPVHVLTDADRYRFEPSGAARIDLWEFRALAELGVNCHEQGDAARAVAAFEAAVALYRGDFMADEPYADWCQQERELLRETCLELLQRLAALTAAAAEWDRSVRFLRTAVDLDPLRERNHRELMQALWAVGRRDEAVRQYHLCQGLLRRELGVPPLTETKRLFEQIRLRPSP